MQLSYNIKQIGNFCRVTLYRNGEAFYSSALMTRSLAEVIVTNPAYVHAPNKWSETVVSL